MRLATRLTTSLCEEVQLTASQRDGLHLGLDPKSPQVNISPWGRSTSTQPLALKHQKASRRYRSKQALIARGGICFLSDTAGVSLATTRRLHIWLNCGVNSPQASRELSWLRR